MSDFKDSLAKISNTLSELDLMYENALIETEKEFEMFQKNLNDLLQNNRKKLENKSVSEQIKALKEIAKEKEKLKSITLGNILAKNKKFHHNFKTKANVLMKIATDKIKKAEARWEIGFNAEAKKHWSKALDNVSYYDENKLPFIDLNEVFNKFQKEIIKLTTKLGMNLNEKEYLENVVKTERICNLILEKINKNQSPLLKNENDWLADNQEEAKVINILSLVKKHNDCIDLIKVIENSNSLITDDLINKIGVCPDKESFIRAKRALKGVKDSLGDLSADFFAPEEIDYDLNLMYLSDALDHLKLSKSCFVNNLFEMDENSRLDTSSRELIDDKLWNYLRSDKFYDEMEKTKKEKKKLKK